MKLIEQQYELESEMRSTGVEYYKSQVAKAVTSGGESNTLYGILAMKQSVDAVTEAIKVFLMTASAANQVVERLPHIC